MEVEAQVFPRWVMVKPQLSEVVAENYLIQAIVIRNMSPSIYLKSTKLRILRRVALYVTKAYSQGVEEDQRGNFLCI